MKIAVESAGKVMCMLSKRDKDGGIQGDAPGNPFRAVDLEGAVASEDIKMQVSEAPDAIAREEVDVVSVDAGSDDASNAPSGGSGTSTGLFDDLVGSAFRGAHEDVAGSSVRTGDIKAESSIGDGPTGSAKTADGPTGSGDDAPDDALTAFGLADGQDDDPDEPGSNEPPSLVRFRVRSGHSYRYPLDGMDRRKSIGYQDLAVSFVNISTAIWKTHGGKIDVPHADLTSVLHYSSSLQEVMKC